jgi:hypothetical protein
MEALSRDGLGIAKAVNYGNRLDIDDADCLDYFSDDPRTGAVAMYMESVADGKKFLASAKAFAKKKPLVIWKAGKFELGAAAVASHTATLAGAYGLYQAAFRQAGAVEAFTFDQRRAGGRAMTIHAWQQALGLTNGGAWRSPRGPGAAGGVSMPAVGEVQARLGPPALLRHATPSTSREAAGTKTTIPRSRKPCPLRRGGRGRAHGCDHRDGRATGLIAPDATGEKRSSCLLQGNTQEAMHELESASPWPLS